MPRLAKRFPRYSRHNASGQSTLAAANDPSGASGSNDENASPLCTAKRITAGE